MHATGPRPGSDRRGHGIERRSIALFLAVALSALGWWTTRAPSALAAAGTGIQPIAAARLLDTRAGAATVDGIGAGQGPFGPMSTQAVRVTGRAGIPTDAAGVVLEVLVPAPSEPTYVSVWPTGRPQPATSVLTADAGMATANLTVVGVGAEGSVSVSNFAGRTDVVITAVGWFAADSALVPVSPARLADTRPETTTADGRASGDGPLGAGETRAIAVAGRAGVPVGTTGVVLNLTAIAPTAETSLTVWPGGQAQPSVPTWPVTGTAAHLTIVAVGPDGTINVRNESGRTDLAVDVAAYDRAGSGPADTGTTRLADTRPGSTTVDGLFAAEGPLTPGAVRSVRVAGRAGVATNAGGATLLVTAWGATTGGTLSVWPDGAVRPDAATLALAPGRTTATLAVVALGVDGRIAVSTPDGTTHLTVDLIDWYPTSRPAVDPGPSNRPNGALPSGPYATDDTITVVEDSAVVPVPVRTNDRVEPGLPFTVASVTQPAHGRATVADGGAAVTYQPEADFAGIDTFRYSLDASGSTATVRVTVTEVNDPATALGDVLTPIDEDSGVRVVPASALTTNDNAGPGESGQTLTIVAVSAPIGGTAVLVGGNVHFTAPPEFSGHGGFTYTVSDDGTTVGVPAPLTASATVTFSVGPVNDPPTATDLAAAETYPEDGTRNLTDIVAADIDSPDLTATLILPEAGLGTFSTTTVGATTSTFDAGTRTWRASGPTADVNGLLAAVAYTPAKDVHHTFSIAVAVSDGQSTVPGTKVMTGTDDGIIEVNSTLDTVGNDGVCTLREAVTSANADSGSGAAPGECGTGTVNTIEVPAGTFTFAGTDLVPSTTMTIVGAGGGSTTLRSTTAGIDHTAATLTLRAVTLEATRLANGAGTTLLLPESTVVTLSGALTNDGTITASVGLTVSAATFTNIATGTVTATGLLSVTTTGNMSNLGTLTGTGGLQLTTPATITNGGTVSGPLGTLESGTTLTVSAGTFLNNSLVEATGAITITAATVRNETPGGDTREWYRSFTGSDINDSTNSYYDFPDNYEIQYWSKQWTDSQRYVGGAPTFKPMIQSGTSVTLQQFNTGTNVGAVIQAPTVTLSGNGGATFTNNTLALNQQNYRQGWEIYTHYIALGPATYDDHIRRNDDGGVLQSTTEISNIGAGVFGTTTLNSGGFTL